MPCLLVPKRRPTAQKKARVVTTRNAAGDDEGVAAVVAAVEAGIVSVRRREPRHPGVIARPNPASIATFPTMMWMLTAPCMQRGMTKTLNPIA